MDRLVAIPTPPAGPQPRRVPWLGIELATFLVRRLAFNPLSHTGQGSTFNFI